MNLSPSLLAETVRRTEIAMSMLNDDNQRAQTGEERIRGTCKRKRASEVDLSTSGESTIRATTSLNVHNEITVSPSQLRSLNSLPIARACSESTSKTCPRVPTPSEIRVETSPSTSGVEKSVYVMINKKNHGQQLYRVLSNVKSGVNEPSTFSSKTSKKTESAESSEVRTAAIRAGLHNYLTRLHAAKPPETGSCRAKEVEKLVVPVENANCVPNVPNRMPESLESEENAWSENEDENHSEARSSLSPMSDSCFSELPELEPSVPFKDSSELLESVVARFERDPSNTSFESLKSEAVSFFQFYKSQTVQWYEADVVDHTIQSTVENEDKLVDLNCCLPEILKAEIESIEFAMQEKLQTAIIRFPKRDGIFWLVFNFPQVHWLPALSLQVTDEYPAEGPLLLSINDPVLGTSSTNYINSSPTNAERKIGTQLRIRIRDLPHNYRVLDILGEWISAIADVCSFEDINELKLRPRQPSIFGRKANL